MYSHQWWKTPRLKGLDFKSDPPLVETSPFTTWSRNYRNAGRWQAVATKHFLPSRFGMAAPQTSGSGIQMSARGLQLFFIPLLHY